MNAPSTSSNDTRDSVENTENSSASVVVVVEIGTTSGDLLPTSSPSKKPKLEEDDNTATGNNHDAATATAPSSSTAVLPTSPDKFVKEDGQSANGSNDNADTSGGTLVDASPQVEEKEDVVVIDSAVLHQNLTDGDRIQVLWTIENNTSDDDDNNIDADDVAAAGAPSLVLSTSRWWGASLLPWDGTAEEEVAVRTLRYDAYPPHFPDLSEEQVIFAETKDRLLTYPGLEPMIFRREPPIGANDDAARASSSLSSSSPAGAPNNDDDDNAVVVAGRDDLEGIVDGILAGALRRNSALWSSISAARQAEIAESVARKKARLLELLEQHLESHDVISSSDMREILARTMEPTS